MSKFDGILNIPKFQGLNQCTDGHNSSLGYAVDGINFDTSFGGMKPFHKVANIPSDSSQEVDTSIELDTVNGAGALTIAFMTKRWQINGGVVGLADSYRNAYCVIVVDGRLYYKHKVDNSFADVPWTEIMNPETGESFAFENSKFDYVTYELNYTPPVQINADIITAIYTGAGTYYAFDLDDYAFYEVHSDDGTSAYYTNRADEVKTLTVSSKVRQSSEEAPMDCLLITNSQDGMYCLYAPLDSETLSIVPVYVQPFETTVPIKFGALARYSERIWGTAIDTDPDKLMYSAPYDLFNWEQYNDEPDDGAGDIQQPNWDGDKFVAIKNFGASLLAIKQHAIWRITGTTPSELVMKKQYGEGTIAEDSFAINNSVAYMLTDDDIKIYDGNSTGHLRYGYIKDIMENLDPTESIQNSIGRMVQDKYILQVAHSVYGHIFIIYNSAEGTFNICQSEGATALDTYEERLYGLYPANTYDAHGDVTGTYVQFGEFLPASGEQLPVKWTSSWNDLNAKNVTKSGAIVYLMFDRINSPEYATISPTITLYSEKKGKSKTPIMKYNKVKRIQLNRMGRQFKLEMEIPPQPYEWKISTGIQIYMEYDAD